MRLDFFLPTPSANNEQKNFLIIILVGTYGPLMFVRPRRIVVPAEVFMEKAATNEFSHGNRDRRAMPRYQFQVDIEIAWNSNTVWGRVRNISRGGMFIEVANPPEPGAKFSANLSLNVPLRIIGLVRRTTPRYGIGVSFLIPDQADQRRFEALLVALAHGSDPATAAAKPAEGNPDGPLRCFAAVAGSRDSSG